MNIALGQIPQLSPPDAALTTELLYGSLRCRLRLSWLLRLHLRQPDKLPLLALSILHIAAYELLHMERIPAYATVNWAVQAMGDNLGSGLGRLANAVLRTIDRLGEAPRQDDWYATQVADPIERLSIVHSVPAWMIQLWLKAYGPDTAKALAQAAGNRPWPSVRINMALAGWEKTRDSLLQAKTRGEEGGEIRPVGPAGIMFPPGRAPDELTVLARKGMLSWQGAGSQLMLQALRAEEWEGPIWDACAGRGGKTGALLEMGREVRLASDPNVQRLNGLRQELDRLGLPQPELRQAQAQDLEPGFRPRTILLDVPCSGLGALARRPDTRLYRTRQQTEELASTQQAILDAAWGRLAPGGRLVYLTCTVNPAENERQISRLLARPDTQLEIEIPAQPEENGIDSMYGAVVRKLER